MEVAIWILANMITSLHEEQDKRPHIIASTVLNGTSDFYQHANFFGQYLQNAADEPRTYMGIAKLADITTVHNNSLWANWNPRKSLGSGVARGVRIEFSKLLSGAFQLNFIAQETGGTSRAHVVRVDLIANPLIVANKWFWWGVTWDVSGATKPLATIYINGLKPSQTLATNSLLKTHNITSTSFQTGMTMGVFVIDETKNPVTRAGHYDGNFQETKVFGRTFAESEMFQHFDSMRLTNAGLRHHDRSLLSHFIFHHERAIGATPIQRVERTSTIMPIFDVVAAAPNSIMANSRDVADFEPV